MTGGFHSQSTPARSWCEDSTSSCYSDQSRTAPIKKQTQEVMRSFPPASRTAQTKKKTNWNYDQNATPGMHQVLMGQHDTSFYLHEGDSAPRDFDVSLMRLKKWHMILHLRETGLKYDDRNWLLICRLKLKANYKVKKHDNGTFYDVNAEDCRMNLNPEGCFLIEESEWERCKDPNQLKDLAKFQDKRNCKDYKECKNSVVRAGQKIDSFLRDNFFEQYMDILYSKAYEAKLKAKKNNERLVIEEMGHKPTNWKDKRSVVPVPGVPVTTENVDERWLNVNHKAHSTTERYTATVEDLFKPSPSPAILGPEDSVSQVCAASRRPSSNVPVYNALNQTDRRASFPQVPQSPGHAHPGLVPCAATGPHSPQEQESVQQVHHYYTPPNVHPSLPLPPIGHPGYPSNYPPMPPMGYAQQWPMPYGHGMLYPQPQYPYPQMPMPQMPVPHYAYPPYHMPLPAGHPPMTYAHS